MTDQASYYGEPAPQGTVPGPAPANGPAPLADVPDPAPVPGTFGAPLTFVSQPAAVTDPAPVTPDPAPTTEAPTAQAASPAAAASEPAPAVVPPVGSLARYASLDGYAAPARVREHVVLVIGHDTADDGTVRVRGLVLGYADEAASFLPDQLTAN